MCRVVVATPPVQVPLSQEHQNDESAPCLTVRDRSKLSTVSMNDVRYVASLITFNLTPAELYFEPSLAASERVEVTRGERTQEGYSGPFSETEAWYYDIIND